MSILTLTDVCVTYPDGTEPDGTPRTVTALDHANLTADAGTVTALVGPSGSGKSTLLSVIGGLVEPTSGQVVVDGVALHELDENERTAMRRTKVGIVFQQPNLLPALTCVEQLQLVAHLGGASRSEMAEARTRALDLLDRVGLADQADRRPHQLSGGQRQRVNIARALMSSPSVLLTDEPTSALDHERAASVVDLLVQVTREQQLATLMVTHDLEMAESADRIVRVRDGQLHEDERDGSAEGSSDSGAFAAPRRARRADRLLLAGAAS